MTTITTTTASTALMRSVLPRSVTPLDVARNAACKLMSVSRQDFVTGTASVSSIVNFANEANNLTQATGGNQASLVNDPDLGRDVLDFDSGRTDHYILPSGADYTKAFSFVSVFKARLAAIGVLMGNETTTADSRANLTIQPTRGIRVRINSLNVNSAAVDLDTWYAVIGTFDGVDTATVEVLGQAEASSTGAADASGTTNLGVGSPNPNFGFDGQIALSAFFDVDLKASANSALLEDTKTMISQLYGSRVSGIS